jgi:hypothetical protein
MKELLLEILRASLQNNTLLLKAIKSNRGKTTEAERQGIYKACASVQEMIERVIEREEV